MAMEWDVLEGFVQAKNISMQTTLFENKNQTGGAVISPCKQYRYQVWREYDVSLDEEYVS